MISSTLSDGTQAVINQDYLAKLSRLFKKHEAGVRVSFFDLPLIEELIDRNNAPAPLARAREVFLGFNGLAAQELSAPPIAEELLGHLANRQNRWARYHPASIRQLPAFFATLPAGKWVAWENVRRYRELREQVPTLFGPDTNGLDALATTVGREEWSRFVDVTANTEFELVGEPLLKGFTFLLAAFGLAEIAYDSPTHSKYRRAKKAWLTPYDGLRFARLTPLGEFVFRRRDTYELASGPPTRASIVLDETRLLATCRNADSLTELALGQFMEKLAPGRYHLTPKSLVGGCRSRADLEERIRLFRRVVPAKPPAIWEAFFERTLARTSPLEFEPDYLLLKVGADEEIRRLLTSDPALREVVLKAEGMRIAVRRQDLKKLDRRLEQFGYLSPLANLD
ncbi:MAG: hypothetical protein KJ072_09480 [Verrucomicrobia bacterium]|nr:hypothetical protein [Verrucomicrobiota bacterium]